MKVGNKILGLAVGQKSILIAEVTGRGERHVVHRCAEFVFPDGVAMSAPDRLGAELRNFLRSQQFSTKEVIFGLPAKRLVTRRKEVPPANEDVAANTLRLQAEGEFSSELDNLVMDYAGKPSEKAATTVLLMATNKVLVDECEALARVAGLRVHAITSTTAALGRATSRLPGGDGMVLNLGPNGAELVVQRGLHPAQLKHLNVATGADSMPALAAEIRRTMAAIPQNGSPITLALWNTGTLEHPESILEQRLSIPVTTPDVSNLAVTESLDANRYAEAVALGLAALEPAGLAVDFLHSRLAPPKEPGMSLQKKLSIAGGILLAGLVAYAYIDFSQKQTELANLQQKLALRKKAVDKANQEIARYNVASAWLRLDEKATTPESPVRAALFLAMMRDLTTLFPAQGNTLWATDVECKSSDPYTWSVKGESVNQSWPDQVRNAMLKGPYADRFTDAKLSVNTKQARNTTQSQLYTFELKFTYEGIGYKPPATAPAKAAPKSTGDAN